MQGFALIHITKGISLQWSCASRLLRQPTSHSAVTGTWTLPGMYLGEHLELCVWHREAFPKSSIFLQYTHVFTRQLFLKNICFMS